MLNPSKTYTSPVLDAPGVDPKLFEMPVLSSWEAFILATHKAVPLPPPSVDEFVMCPDLVLDDGSSQSSSSPLYSPQTYDYPSSPQIDRASVYSPTTSPSLTASRVLVGAFCAGGRPIKQKGGGYRCPSCDRLFKRPDDAKRHMDTAGVRVTCKYCGKPASGRRDGQHRHLLKNKNCLKVWEAGSKAGRFNKRSVEDAYN